MKNRVKISIDGKGFTLMGEESEEHMRAVATYIDRKMTEVRQKAKAVTLDSSLAYVLTSINVADDYFKEKTRNAEMESRLQELTKQLEEATDQLKSAQQTESPTELQTRLQELEEKLALAEKERIAAENQLDDYLMAMEGGQQGVTRSSTKTKYRKK